ncbi:MAG TPA: ABC transporter substrate-binding protein [Gaiellaceae bacterium]|nr:ABC transporter substrate-binding protein [Gaiellaceae bacterium]
MVLTLAGIVLAAGLLAAETVPSHAQNQGGTLRISSTADPDTVDPTLAGTDTSWWITFATCAKLFNHPDRSGFAGAEVISEVAKGFPRVSRRGTTQTIELRRTYRFHDGTPITAANFVAAFNRAAHPKLVLRSYAAVNGYLTDIVGAGAVMRGKAPAISGVKARGRYTLEIRTTRPLRDLPARLTMPAFCPIAVDAPTRETSAPLGSGPYYVAARVPNRQIVLERNTFYRGPRPANADRVLWSVGLGQEACLQAVERDTIDYCLGRTRGYGPVPDRQLAAKYGINRPDGRFFSNATPQTFYFGFNHDRPAFKSSAQIPLKQAINQALDRRALARAAGFGEATDQILPPAMTRAENLYPTQGISSRDLGKARGLLAKTAVMPERLVLYAPSDGFFPAWAQIFQRNLRQLGLDVTIRYFPFYKIVERAGTRGEPFDVAISAWSIDYADPVTFFGPLLNGNNLQAAGNSSLTYFDRPRYNREIERVDRLRGSARRNAWARLDVEMMRRDPPWAPVMNGTQRDFVSESFGCYLFQPVVGHLDLNVACKQ